MFKKINIIVIILSIFAIMSCTTKKDKYNSLTGIWEYRQANRSNVTGYDSEGEKIEFRLKNDSLVGIYFGVEREGESGLFYSAAEIKSLTLNDSGKISFIVPERTLYERRPKNLEDAKKFINDNNGMTRFPLMYKEFFQMKC